MQEELEGKTTGGTDMELSSLSSTESFEPQAFTGVDPSVEQPTIDHELEDEIDPEPLSGNPVRPNSEEILSVRSSNTLKKLDSNAIEKVLTHNAVEGNTETLESLKTRGLDLRKKAIPDYNNPAMHTDRSQFPEEYQIETETGLVKVKTLQSLNRLDTRVSLGSKPSTNQNMEAESAHDEQRPVGYDEEKLKKAVDKNKKEIEKYQKHKHEKGIKGFMSRLFG